MQPRLSLVTLGVEDLARATRFYEEVLDLPKLPSPPSIAFFELGRTWLSLYPREALAEDATVPAAGSGFRGFTLAHNVASPEEVDRLLGAIAERGGRIVKPARRADWGGYSGYFADPDGFLWEVAWNPHFPHLD
ncbi:MAG: VOC family protein [Deltaproteobacteria bacterium]|nr:VOC family protein [Deltaproteobacteria bacterium]